MPNYLMLGVGYRFNNKYPHTVDGTARLPGGGREARAV